MNKHTPGPWELRGARLVTDKHGVVIAEKIGSNDGDSESNARLIASAPTMLSTLERVSEWLKQHGTPENQGIACDVFQAIDAAKGNP